MNITSFPDSYVITIDRLSGRRDECLSHLKSLGIVPQTFHGLDGNDIRLSREKSGRYGPWNVMPWLNMGSTSICLGLNHWCLWQHIHMSGMETAVIFEDDVLLPDGFLDSFYLEMSVIPDGWDVVFLGVLFPKRFRDESMMSVEWLSKGICRYHCPRPGRWDGGIDGTHAYMVSSSGAKKLAEKSFSLNESIDRYMTFGLFPGMDVFVWVDSGVVQKKSVLPDDMWKSTAS